MSFNTSGAVEVPLETFGSLVTEMAPVDLPAGVSPDNADVVYVPGGVASRPALRKVFTLPFPATPPGGVPNINYAKSYVTPAGVVNNLYFDTNGVLWVEDATHSPGIYRQLAATGAAGAFAKSITAFGREYIAISDGLHGLEMPLQFDGTNLDRVTVDGPGAAPSISSIALASAAISSLTRVGNVVTAVTASAHNLKVGYQAQLSGVQATAVGSGVSSIVIDNEDSPGLATVTMSAAHGLVPGNFIEMFGVTSVVVGTSISSITRAGNLVTVATSAAHNLSPGANVEIAGVSDTSYNGTFQVANVLGSLRFTYAQTDTDGSSSGGNAKLNWPIASGQYQVVSAPTSTKFQIQVYYSDGTWTSGTVTSPWNGTFYVSNVLSSTSYTYQSYGPAITAASGTSTPYGQAAPGQHQMQVLYLTRQGALTRPSPAVSFIANGGQYLNITNIPIGPANIVARILAFTGASGAFFFYIPAPAEVNGQIVSTATQINDNVTTTVTLDFSDNTLYAATGISTAGNNLANQIVLDGALGFGYYAGRLIAYGQRNKIQNLLNMSFDGGALPIASTVPAGWSTSGPGGGSLTAAGHLGSPAWSIAVTPNGGNCGLLYQSFAVDSYGAPIATPNTAYRLRAWLKPALALPDLVLTVLISSTLAPFSSYIAIPGNQMSASGAYVEANFTLPMPAAAIPSDLTLNLYATSTVNANTLVIDEVSILYQQTPYLDSVLAMSYVNNPEGFDGVTGKLGPATDTHKVMDFGVIRDTLYLLTQDPAGRLHETVNNAATEPAGWTVSEVGANCGTLSAFALTKSQADDQSASGGEEWLAWASASGARIFSGDMPWKISQEIQPDWDAIHWAAAKTVWALNDPAARVIYFGLPTGTWTAPNLVYPLNYRELDTAYQIAMSPPFHPSFSGRLIATDNTRKWTRWRVSLNGAALMYRSTDPRLSAVFFSGTGNAGGVLGNGNVYTLDATKLTDDDYGQISPYYVTYFFVNHDQEMALQLGGHRKMLAYLAAYVSGFGVVTITPLVNNLQNPWPLTCVRSLVASPNFDLEWAGGSATGQRIAFRVASAPVAPGLTDNSFSLSKLVAALKPAGRLPVRGSAT